MALEIKQQLKLTQQLTLTPQLQLAIRLLQLSQPELVELVEKELIENPLLEEESGSFSSSEMPTQAELVQEGATSPLNQDARLHDEVGGKSGEFKNEPADFDWENYFNTYNNAAEGPINYSDELPTYENTLASQTTLSDHLLWQAQLSELNPQEMEIATLIIGSLNEDGYFMDSLDDISEKTEVPLEEVEAVLSRVQDFDPPGIAARDLRECLLLQLKHFGSDRRLLEKIILNYLPLLEKKDYLAVSRELKIELEEVLRLVRLIHELEPKPGREFSNPDLQYITPDIFVSKIGNEWVVTLNEDGLPKLKVNSLYRSMMSGDARGETKDYVQDKLRSALWLIKSIHQRQRTLYKTAKTIVQFQQEFFEKGLDYLKPMVLRDVAAEIEMHESTVSRVTTSKYMHTPHGTFELKFFFNSGIANQAGESIASESIKKRIKHLIAQENPKKPLSDEEIVRLLHDAKIDIARRTVAKYRENLGILPSSKRKQLY